MRDLREQKADLERLRDSGLGDKDRIDEQLDDIDRQIDDQEAEIDSRERETGEDAQEAPDQASGAPEQQRPADQGPMDIDRVHNFETFPEVPDHEPAEPVDEPVNAWEFDEAPPVAKGPLSDDAERAIDEAAGESGPDRYGADLRTYPRDRLGADLEYTAGPREPEPEADPATQRQGAGDHLPSLVGEGAGTMGGGLFDGETGVLPPPSIPPPAIDDDIASRPSGGMPSTLVAVPIAVVLGILAFLAASRIGVPEVAGTATTAPSISVSAPASVRPSVSGGLQYFEYTITPMRFSWDGIGIVNLGVSVNTSAVNLTYRKDEVLTYTWTVDAGPCAKTVQSAPSVDSISVDFLNAPDGRGGLRKCPGGPSYPLNVRLVIRDRWGAEYVREFKGATGEDRSETTIGEQIKVHHDGP